MNPHFALEHDVTVIYYSETLKKTTLFLNSITCISVASAPKNGPGPGPVQRNFLVIIIITLLLLKSVGGVSSLMDQNAVRNVNDSSLQFMFCNKGTFLPFVAGTVHFDV